MFSKALKTLLLVVTIPILSFVVYVIYIIFLKQSPTDINVEIKRQFKNYKNNSGTIVLLFSPDCGPCFTQLKNIYTNIDKFNGVNTLLASTEDSLQTSLFFHSINKNWTSHTTNPNYAYNAISKFRSYFTGPGLPKIYLFDKNGKLIYKYNTAVPTDTIIAKLMK